MNDERIPKCTTKHVYNLTKIFAGLLYIICLLDGWFIARNEILHSDLLLSKAN